MRKNTVSSVHKLFWTAYVLLLIVGSLAPVDLHGAPEQSDKVIHFLAYGMLVLLWPEAWVRSFMAMFGFAAGLGFFLEIAQGMLPTGRFMDLWDALANAAGAGLGVGVVMLWPRIMGKGWFSGARRQS